MLHPACSYHQADGVGMGIVYKTFNDTDCVSSAVGHNVLREPVIKNDGTEISRFI